VLLTGGAKHGEGEERRVRWRAWEASANSLYGLSADPALNKHGKEEVASAGRQLPVFNVIANSSILPPKALLLVL
jgi:hypothetical protein